MPRDWDSAVALIGSLVRDENLGLGLATFGLILLGSAVLAWAVVSVAKR